MHDVDENNNLVRLAQEEIKHLEEIEKELFKVLELFKPGLGDIDIFDRVELMKLQGNLFEEYEEARDSVIDALNRVRKLKTDLSMHSIETLRVIFRKGAIRGHLKLVN